MVIKVFLWTAGRGYISKVFTFQRSVRTQAFNRINTVFIYHGDNSGVQFVWCK